MKKKELTPELFTLLAGGLAPGRLRVEVTAGIVVGIVALPLAVAFAIASGVGPEQGIITAVLAGFVISFLGGSRVQIGGPTGAFVVIVYSIIQRYGLDGLMLSTIMAGFFLIVMGVLRLGSLIEYVPQTLITGFTSGIAVLIFSTQVKDLLGLSVDNLPTEFVPKWIEYFRAVESTNLFALAIGLGAILIVRLTPRFSPRVPGAFVAIVASTAVVAFFDLPVETIRSRFGLIEAGVPVLHLPAFDLPLLGSLLLPAFTIALLGALESLLSATVADGVIGGRHRSNMELVAQGAANVITPLFGGIPATGAIARTMTNIKLGARTPIAGLVHAVTLGLIYAVAMPLVSHVPLAALAGILVEVAWNMSEYRYFIQSCRINRYETVVLLTTFFLTVLADLTIAIPIGFVLSLLLFMKRMSDAVDINPLLAVKPEDGDIPADELRTDSDVQVFEITGPLFFGSVGQFVNIYPYIRDEHSTIIFRMRYVPIIDSSGLKRLAEIVRDLDARGMRLYITGATASIRQELEKLHIVPADHIFEHFDDAIRNLDESRSAARR
jgi:SulP family sulfate permease